MNKTLRNARNRIAAIAILLPLVALIACGGYGSQPAATPAPAQNSSQPAVTISGFAFSPATLTVKAGTTVTWTNNDPTAHTVTSDNGAFDSGNVASNGAFSYTFASAGTFPYHCAIHASMKASVVVQ